MRDLRLLGHLRIEAHERKWLGREYGQHFDHVGIFEIASKVDGNPMRVVLSKGYGNWDHVSVSRTRRTPTWGEMEQIRRLFFEDHEAVMQYHAPVNDYVDGSVLGHPHCLHLWRPTDNSIPKPPKWMVGGMTREDASQVAEKDGF